MWVDATLDFEFKGHFEGHKLRSNMGILVFLIFLHYCDLLNLENRFILPYQCN